MKQAYERPALVKHQPGLMNKLSGVQAMRPMERIDGVPVKELTARFGSPLFVFSERTLVSRARELREAFALRLPRTQLAWSYKTNYLDAVCKVFHREGSWAEVVSEMELDKALRHVPGSQVIFNGPYKPEGALEKAFRAGVRVHLDHFDELARAEAVARRLGLRPQVAIRVNMALPGTPPWSRFGFNLENGQAMDAVRRLRAGGVLELRGLHSHIGTFVQEVDAYRQEARQLAGLANRIAAEQGVAVDWIDLGGGFASRNTLHGQYLPGSQASPSFAQYAEAVADGLSALQLPGGREPTILLETGRALVDEAGHLLTTVHASKRLPDGRRALIVDAGVNVLFTAFWYRHELAPAQELTGTPEPTVVFGPLCMAIDVVRDQLLFPPMAAGDQLVVKGVGAYNVTQWMQFITERPAVVMISRDGEASLIRRRETVETLLGQEELPAWLR
ncbi:MAG: alanine racemase [Deltaproteobacteria bacterium]|nr:alanine racemase [Deltaproteobacteria bacterium]